VCSPAFGMKESVRTVSPDPLASAQPPRAKSAGRGGLAGAWAWTTLAVVFGVALPFWPYTHACGWRLWVYCGAVFVLLVVGLRAALVTWREHVGLAHALALLATMWALTLGAETVLPRVHYAKAIGTWSCGPAVVAPPPRVPGAAAEPRESAGPHPGAADTSGPKSQEPPIR
jgi:hypothetical protein